MPNYQKQLKINSDPIAKAMEELINPKVNHIDYDQWINNKRSIGKKKFNRMDKRQRRFAIKRKQLGINQ